MIVLIKINLNHWQKNINNNVIPDEFFRVENYHQSREFDIATHDWSCRNFQIHGSDILDSTEMETTNEAGKMQPHMSPDASFW